MYKKFIKRFLDVIFSLLAIIILLPIYIIISIFVLIFMGWPIFFKQPRPGYKEKIFNMYKFRTMNNKKDKEGNLLPDKDRLTKFGIFLRKTSLDELPELFAILLGKMSFIGPRPLLVEYLPYYTKEEHHRHDVRPGLTGLAQVSGRNNLNWDERFKIDLIYINNLSFINDLKVLFKTVKKVIMRQDIVAGENYSFQRLDVEREYVTKDIVELNANMFKKYKNDIKKLLIQLESINDNNVDEKLNNMERFLNNKSAIINAYIMDKKLIAFIWGYFNKNQIHINYFVVDKKYQKKGIGSKLIYSFIIKHKPLELFVYKNNNKAIKFYESKGFKRTNYNEEKYKMQKR